MINKIHKMATLREVRWKCKTCLSKQVQLTSSMQITAQFDIKVQSRTAAWGKWATAALGHSQCAENKRKKRLCAETDWWWFNVQWSPEVSGETCCFLFKQTSLEITGGITDSFSVCWSSQKSCKDIHAGVGTWDAYTEMCAGVGNKAPKMWHK